MTRIGQLDTTHAMYQPDKRAKAKPPRIVKEHTRSDLPPAGDREAREAWMRNKQAKKRGLTEWERYETALANRRPNPAPLRPSQRTDDINEAEHAKEEGRYERAMVFQALEAASKGVK